MSDTITLMIAGQDVALGARFYAMLVVVFVAGIIRGFTGFGSAMLIVPALAALYGPAQAVVIEVLIEVPVVLGFVPLAVREADRRTILPMLGMFVLFVPLGAVLLTVVNPELVKVLISLFVLAAVVAMSQQARIAALLSPKADYLAGALSGVTQGLTGMGGPLFAMALIARGDSSVRTRANISALAGGIIVLSVVSFWAFGLITVPILVYAALAIPAMMAGVWVGAVLFKRWSHRNLRGVILCFLAVTALVTLIQTLGA